MYDSRLPARPRLRQVRPGRRRRDGQLPPARRLVDLRHPGPDGPAVVAALPADRRQGNFGSPGNDPAAAMRYTECRLTPLAMEMLRDIDEDTVDFIAELRRQARPEPTSCRRGSRTCWSTARPGIAVGMATNIPPHNLREVAAAVQLVRWSTRTPTSRRPLDALMELVKGPDFPTGGADRRPRRRSRTPTGPAAARSGCARWSRSRRTPRAATILVVTELPYQVNPDNLAESIAELVRTASSPASPTSRDESSDRIGMRLVITLKRDAVAKVVLNNLYKHTQLQDDVRRQHAGPRRRGAAHAAAGPVRPLLRRAPDRGHRPAHPRTGCARPRSGPTSCAAWSRRSTCSTR